jgi:hypothetical protein
MGSSQGRADNGASAASSSSSEDQPSPRSRLYDPLDNSSFMSGWLLLRPPGKRKLRAMWCLVKDGMLHEFKRAESRKPRASRLLEGSLAMPIAEGATPQGQKRGFQLVLGGLYGSQQQEAITYELVDGSDDDVERWLNSISAASLLAAIASNGGMPHYAVEALAVSEEKALRRERRTRAVAGKAAQAWDSCSVASSALSTASTVSVASASSLRSSSSVKSSACAGKEPAAPAALPVHHDALPSPPSGPTSAAPVSEDCDVEPPPKPIPSPAQPLAASRHFKRRAPTSMRLAQAGAAPAVDPAASERQPAARSTSPDVRAQQLTAERMKQREEEGEFDV